MLFTPLPPPTFGLVAAAEWNWTKLRFYVLSLSSALLAATLVQNQGVSVTFAGLNRLFINLKRKIFHKFDNNSNCTNVETSHWRDNWDPETGGHCLPPQARCFFLKHIVFGNLNFGKCIFVLNRECMPGMYSGAGTCLACHASCKTCDGSKVFFHSYWISASIVRFFATLLTSVGSQARDCTTCYTEHRLYVSACVSTCPRGSRPSTQVSTLILRLSLNFVATLQTHTCLANLA